MDTDIRKGSLIQVVGIVPLKVSFWTYADSKSIFVNFSTSFCSLVYLIPIDSSLSERVPRIWYVILGKTFFTGSLHVVKSRSELNVLLKKVSQLRQQNDWKTSLMLLTYHIWLLHLISLTVFSCFCTLRRASSTIMFPLQNRYQRETFWVKADLQQ